MSRQIICDLCGKQINDLGIDFESEETIKNPLVYSIVPANAVEIRISIQSRDKDKDVCTTCLLSYAHVKINQELQNTTTG